MLILAMESSAKAASVALCRDGELLGQYFQRSGLTHSRTLLPMVEDLLRNTEVTLAEVDAIAVAQGPGSFTGVRIGVATAKGLCWGADKPAVGVSTLEAMAWLGQAAPEGAVICAAMDARREQIYNALFEIREGKPCRLCEDRAVAAADVATELAAMGRHVWVVGDGWSVCSKALTAAGVPHSIAPEVIRYQNAWGVAMAAMEQERIPAEELLPIYLRLSQAERERQERMNKENEK